jgi:Flp pilus assembly protein TadD
MDGSDVVVWRRLAALAMRAGRRAGARLAMEQGLACSPDHPLLLEDLVELLIANEDDAACQV